MKRNTGEWSEEGHPGYEPKDEGKANGMQCVEIKTMDGSRSNVL